MNRLVLLALTACVIYAVEVRSSQDNIFKIKRATALHSQLLQDSNNPVHIRKRRSRRESFAFILFDNRSNRTVKLWFRDVNKPNATRREHELLEPGKTARVFTYDKHEWSATENVTGIPLLINNKQTHIQKANTRSSRAICIIKRQGQATTDIPEKFVETLIVVDKSAQNEHRNTEQAKRYVEILINLASDIFQHKSLTQHGVKIHIVPSNIIFLKYDLKFDPSERQNNLYKACRHMNDIGNDGPKMFDHKLFLTRTEFGAGGYARQSGMCSHYSSCSIVEDQGFSGAFLIAHEIAHSFGVPHGNFAQFSGNIMTSTVHAVFNNYQWSLQSQRMFLRKIRLRQHNCLDNKPSEVNQREQYPGIHFTLEEQCHLEYDKMHNAWKGWMKRDPCPSLKCQMPKWPSFYRNTQNPALDGTECDINKWCISGRCQTKTTSSSKETVAVKGRLR